MITIDYQSKLPLYEQIAKRFQTLILKRRASTRFADAFRSFPRNGSFHQSEYDTESVFAFGTGTLYLSGKRTRKFRFRYDASR